MDEADLTLLDVNEGDHYHNAALTNAVRFRERSEIKTSEMEDEESQQEQELTNIDLTLLTSNQRLQVKIPNYDNHYRLYFENPDGFVNNQELRPNQRK